MKRREASCSKVRRLLSPYIDGRVSAGERERVEEHVRTCAQCRSELDSLQMTVQLLHRVPTAPPPRSFALGRELATRPVRQPRLLWLRPATVLAVAVLLFLFVGDMLQVFEPSALPQPTPAPAAPEESKLMAPGTRDMTEEAVPSPPPEATQEAGRPWASFWLHQMEIAFAALLLALGSIWLLTIRRRRKGSGARKKAG